MAATFLHGDDAKLRQLLMNMLADTGHCVDFWDIEVMLLRTQGYSRDEARMATADAETRRALNERCHNARMRLQQLV